MLRHCRPGRLYGCLLLLAGVTIGAPAQAQTPNKSRLPDGPGRAVTERICANCHGPGIFTKRRLDREGWAEVVDDMIRRGAKGEDEDFVLVMDYLVQNFSKTPAVRRVNVNSAEAGELAEVLGLAEDQAVTLVAHRRAKGNFKSIDDLKKVPGIDTQAVEARKDRIDF